MFFADGNEVNSRNLTDQNHNNIPGTNYNSRNNGKSSGTGVHKIDTGATTTDTIAKTITSNDATKKIGDLEDYQAKNDSNSKGSTMVSM